MSATPPVCGASARDLPPDLTVVPISVFPPSPTAKDTAWEFVKFCTLNEDTADWWIDFSQGDTVSLKSALEKHKDDENAIYGGEKLYQFWLEQAKEIDTSKVTRYDQAIGDAWGQCDLCGQDRTDDQGRGSEWISMTRLNLHILISQ